MERLGFEYRCLAFQHIRDFVLDERSFETGQRRSAWQEHTQVAET